MNWVILLLCVPAAIGIYVLIVRPLLVPLSGRIPTGKEYRASLSHTNRSEHEKRWAQGRRMSR